MATDARAYYDVDTQGFDPNTKQTRAFNQATAGVNPDTGQAWTTQERQALSDFFANEARKAQAQLPQNTAAPSGAKAPAQKARAPMDQGEAAAVENWLRTPEAQNFLGGQPAIGQGEMAMTGGGAPASPRVTGQGEMAMTGGGAPASPPQDTDPFMGESPRDQQQSQREAMINYLMGLDMQRRHQPAPMPRMPQQPMMPRERPYYPGWGVVGGSRVNPNPIGRQGPRPQPRFNAFQVPQNRGWLGGY